MFDANEGYEENYDAGPRARFNASGVLPRLSYLEPPRYVFLGVPVHVPFGIPAGPLLNARYVRAAMQAGFCLPTYKTVRARSWKSHPWPNVLVIEKAEAGERGKRAEPDLPLDSLFVADGLRVVRGRLLDSSDYSRGAQLSISNSFGVPSRSPEQWSEDFQSLAGDATTGTQVVLSFQGTQDETRSGSAAAVAFVEDTCKAAVLAYEAALRAFPLQTPLLEINLSCPNEAGAPIYRDVARSMELLGAVRTALDVASGSLPSRLAPRAKLIAKIGVLPDADVLAFVRGTRGVIDAVSAINTVSARILSSESKIILGAGVESGGVCGRAIFSQALRMVDKLVAARRALRIAREEFTIIAVGGAGSPDEFRAFLGAGADAVQSATGAMWNLELASQVARSLAVPFEVHPA